MIYWLLRLVLPALLLILLQLFPLYRDTKKPKDNTKHMGAKIFCNQARIPIGALIIQLDRKAADGRVARTAGFEVFTVCLSISVSIMCCSSWSSHKFEAETVKIVRNVSWAPCITEMRSDDAGCMMKQELHLVLWGVVHYEELFSASGPKGFLKNFRWMIATWCFNTQSCHKTALKKICWCSKDLDVYQFNPVYWNVMHSKIQTHFIKKVQCWYITYYTMA